MYKRQVGDIAYLPDVKTVDLPASIQATQNLDVLVLDALRYTQHPTHMNVDEAIAYIKQVKPKQAYLTNMHNAIDFETLRSNLPPGIEPAFDGLKIRVAAKA